jgi:predicted DNA binding protein
MSVVAHFTVPADQFVLGEVLEVRSGTEVRLESMIPTGDAVVPYFWVPADQADPVHGSLDGSDLVDEVTVVDELPAEVLFRVSWSDDVDGLLGLIRDADAALLEAKGLGDDWTFRMRFAERSHLSAFYRACVDRGLTPQLEEVNSPFEQTRRGGFGVSDAQREILLAALEEGYFDVPRGINLTELAAEMGISDTAASQRIRRGVRSLLAGTLASRATGEQGEHDGGG